MWLYRSFVVLLPGLASEVRTVDILLTGSHKNLPAAAARQRNAVDLWFIMILDSLHVGRLSQFYNKSF